MISILDESGSIVDPNVGPIIVGCSRVAFAGRYGSIFKFNVNRFP